MACQISYDTIRDLFFKSLAFDKTTYSSYSNMVSSIMGMNIDSETKVHTIWYMGILYNQSIKHDDSIITEDLPLQVSALVVDKLNDDAADFEKLLEEVNQLFVPAAPAVTPTPKPITLNDKVKALVKKANSGKVADVESAILDFVKLSKSDIQANNDALKNAFNKDILDIINRKTTGSTRALLLSYLQTSLPAPKPEPVISTSFVDISEEPGLGKDFYVVRNEDGNLIETVFNSNDDTYYIYENIFEGDNFEDLEPYVIKPTDFIAPIQYKEEATWETKFNNQGKLRINEKLSNNGITLSNNRLQQADIVPDTNREKSNAEYISEMLAADSSLSRRLNVVADIRRTTLNRQRLARIRAVYPGYQYEVDLKPAQVNYLKVRKNPIIAFLRDTSGVQLTLQLEDTPYFNYITTLDNLAIVEPSGKVTPFDWNNSEHLYRLRDTSLFQKNQKYTAPTDEDVNRLKDSVQQIKVLKAEIAAQMGDRDVYTVPKELVVRYIDVFNSIKFWDFVNAPSPTGKRLSDLYEDLKVSGSTFKANVVKTEAGIEPVVEEQDVVGIISKNPKVPSGFEFLNPLETGYMLTDTEGNMVTLESFYTSNGVDIATLQNAIASSKYKTYYLIKQASGWTARPMQVPPRITSAEQKVSFFAAMMGLKNLRPDYNPANPQQLSQFIQEFNNSGWGFNPLRGLAANVDYIRKTKDQFGADDFVYGIRFRAFDKTFPFMEEFNKANISVEFSFNGLDVERALAPIYKAMGVDISKYNTIKSRIALGVEIANKLEQNKDAIGPEVQAAINKLSEIANQTINNLGKQLDKAIEKNKAVIADPSTLTYILFENIRERNNNTFKLRVVAKERNPLRNYMIFETGQEARNSELTVKLTRAGIVPKSIQATPVIPNPPSPTQVKNASNKIKPFKPGADTKVKWLVDSLDSIKKVDDVEWNKQIDEIKRLLGNSVTIEQRDLTGMDVKGIVLGYFEDKTIHLNNVIKAGGVPYHEAFHGVFRMAFRTAERDLYLKTVKIISGGVQSDAGGKHIQYKGVKTYFRDFKSKRRFEGIPDDIVENLIYEEFLAEDFRKYKESGVKPVNSLILKLLNILDKILNFFSSERVAAERRIKGNFRAINAGSYADVQGDPYTAPRAFELVSVPTFIDGAGMLQDATVSTQVNDQLRNRIVYELLQLTSTEINKNSNESFNVAYDKITKELIDYYRVPTKGSKAQEIKDKYEPMFRQMRFMMGAAYREDVSEKFTYLNNTGNVDFDDYPFYINDSDNPEESTENLVTAVKTFESFRDDVKKDFYELNLINEQLSEEYDEQQATESETEDEDGVVAQDGPNEATGDRFDDSPYYKPFDGNAAFKKLFRYVKYEYTDPELGFKYDKMVNSKTITDTISKVLANVPIEDMIPTLERAVDTFKDSIDQFYDSKVLTKYLNKVMPVDMQETMDLYYALKSTVDLIKDRTALDPITNKPTKSVGVPFYNMFHKVFDNAILPVISVGYDTNFDEVDGVQNSDKISYFNTPKSYDLVQNQNARFVKEKLYNDIINSLNNITATKVNQIKQLFEQFSYETPSNKTEFNRIVNTFYTATTIAGFNIPRTVFEFTVAVDAELTGKNTRSSVLKNIINDNFNYYEEGYYFDPDKFADRFLKLINGYNKSDSQAGAKLVNAFMGYYTPAAVFQSKYNPAFSSTRLRNLDGKAINQLTAYSPDVRLVQELKRIVFKEKRGFSDFIDRYYPGMDSWFNDNPFTSVIMNPSDEFATEEEENMYFFMQKFGIGISGGFYQTFGGKASRSTTNKSMGEKAYMLFTLGSFANRKRYQNTRGGEYDVFMKPITQYEATSTLFLTSGLYNDYNSKDAENKILSNYTSVVKQEYNRIKNAWQNRYRTPINQRFEGYTIKTNEDGSTDVNSRKLRAYNFNKLGPMWTLDANTDALKKALTDAAIAGQTFEEAMQKISETINISLERELNGAIAIYAKNEFEDFLFYLKSLDIDINNDIPGSINIEYYGEKGERRRTDVSLLKRTETKKLNELGKRIAEESFASQMGFLEDFFYNYHYNALFVNQIYDSDYSVGIGSFVNYFKRKKSGVASGLTQRNPMIPSELDNTVSATLSVIKGYIDPKVNPQQPMSTVKGSAPVVMNAADGQTWTGIDRRIKKGIASGLLSDDLIDMLKAARVRSLSDEEIGILADNDIYLNSDKPVVAHPLFYFKDSEHVLLRGDISYIDPGDEDIMMIYDYLNLLYAELDDIDLITNPDGMTLYKSILEEIHSHFKPQPGRAMLHHFLNAIEYYNIDKLFDTEVSKRATRPPLVLDVSLLENNILDGNTTMTYEYQDDNGVRTISVPAVENGYINLSYNAQAISNSFVYEQVKVSEASDVITDPIQENLHIPNQITEKNYPHLKDSIKAVKNLQEELGKSRMEVLNRLLKTNDIKSLLTKMIQQGLINQGGADNILKFYELNEDGTGKFNLNLPIMGKTPLFYFFSLYNKTLFSPKVAGKKYIHAAPVGYKIVIDKEGKVIPREKVMQDPEKYAGYETRYPTVEIKDGKVYVEVIIPRELARNDKERRFFEKLYATFLGSRIPIEGKRSSVVVKVVDYLDAAYNNTIIVPTIVHYWAGSDMDIDAVYSKRYDYYTIYKGGTVDLIQYGEYDYLKKTYGISEDEAKFVEYLYYTSEDTAFKELIGAEKQRLKDHVNLKALSMRTAADSFSGQLKNFFGDVTADQFETILKDNRLKELNKGIVLALGQEQPFDKNRKAQKLSGLEGLAKAMGTSAITADKETTKALKLLQNLVATINVLKENDLPSTPEKLAAFTTKHGNPVSSTIFNKLLTAKMDLLADEQVQQDFIFNEEAEENINKFKRDNAFLEPVISTSQLKNSDLSTPQSVGRVNGLVKGSKKAIGYIANDVKAIILLSTADVKLAKDYAFTVIHNDAKPVLKNKTDLESVKKSGNTVGVATDDGKHQVLGPLSINYTNIKVTSAMNAYSYPEQFGRIIHSVDAISNIIKDYMLNVDPGYVKPKQLHQSFATYVNNAIQEQRSKADIPGLWIIKDGNAFLNPEAITIEITDIDKVVESASPSGLNIRILNKKGEVYTDDVARVILLGFYSKMIEIGNGMSFNFATVTNVLKSINPSFNSLERIKKAVEYIDTNEIFVDSNKIYKAFPILDFLINTGIKSMEEQSKKVLLDQTNLFKGVVSTLDTKFNTSADQLTLNLKSVVGFTALQSYIKQQAPKIDPFTKNWREQFILEIQSALTAEYWMENSVDNDLNIIKNKFQTEDNEFLRVLSTKPARFQGDSKGVNVIVSNAGNSVLPETQNKLINDFYSLINHSEEQVRKATLRIAAHGIVKDGALPTQGSYLRIIAPTLFTELSNMLDLVQNELAKVDNNPKIKTAAQYIKALDGAFSTIYGMKVTSSQILMPIMKKMVAIETMNGEVNKNLSMSFAAPATDRRAGKYNSIPLTDFTTIVDSILPKNKNLVYTKTKTGTVVPASISITSTITRSKTRFEFWKADEKQELYFDLSNIPDELKNAAQRLLKANNIYRVGKTDVYSFPLYQINTYEGGQVFMIESIDGKPIDENFFQNLYEVNKSGEPYRSLLKGKTATYKTMFRQGVDRIQPHAFSNSVGVQIRESIVGDQLVTSSKSNKVKQLPETADDFYIDVSPDSSMFQMGGESGLTDSTTVKQRLRDKFSTTFANKTYQVEDYLLDIGSYVNVYTVTGKNPNTLYMDNKPQDDEGKDRFAQKMGFANMQEFLQDQANQNWFYPLTFKQNHILLTPYIRSEISVNMVENIGGESVAVSSVAPPPITTTYIQTNKTQSGNVIVNPIYTATGLDYDAMQKYAKDNNMVYSLRLRGDTHFGNPFGENPNAKGVVKRFNGIKESVQAYYDWITTDKYDLEFPQLLDRKKWIKRVLSSGILKDKKILYWKELNESSHANVLDQLIQETSISNEVPTSDRPVFDLLPSKSTTPTMTYAGIGSRETPQEVLDVMPEVAKYLESLGYTLRSGAAPGADAAFEKGVKSKKEIFLGNVKTGERELKIAEEIHPAWDVMLNNARKKAIAKGNDPERSASFVANLMARNTNQIFGKNLDTPVDFVLFYAEETTNPLRPKGGTGQAVEMARRKGIPTINLADTNWRAQLKTLLSTQSSTSVKPKGEEVAGLKLSTPTQEKSSNQEPENPFCGPNQ